MHVLLNSHQVVSDSSATLWTVARQALLSMGFPRQKYWGGLPFPSPGDLPNPGIEPTSPALAGGFSTTEPPGKPSGKYSSNLTKLTQFKPPGMMSGEQRQGTASRQRGITLVKVQMYKHSKLFPP